MTGENAQSKIATLSDEECKTITNLLEPYLKNGSVEIRRGKGGVMIYYTRRKEIKRLSEV